MPGLVTTLINANVLIVEDDPIISDLIAWRVRELGYRVCSTVQTGEDAIEYCRKCPPDVILMDIGLKGKIDGIEAGTRIKQQMKIPLIFLTAHDEEKILEQARKAKPDGFITKPFTDNDLRIALNFVL